MVKIKQKKTMNLPQLIEHIEQTDYEACVYQADDAPVYVRVGRIKGIHIEGSGTVFPHNTFTVEVEEEITEDTEIPILVSIGRENKNEIGIHYDCRIGQFLDNEDFNYYVLNDDDTLTLIWKNGKLVE